MLKHSLLITHGTIYGIIAGELPYHIFPDITDNITVIGNAVEPGDGDFPFMVGPVLPLVSDSITHNEPIDIIHGNAGPGVVSPSALFPWEQCAALLVRL
jgi:hypothetical protein